jgi:hypothetical protein
MRAAAGMYTNHTAEHLKIHVLTTLQTFALLLQDTSKQTRKPTTSISAVFTLAALLSSMGKFVVFLQAAAVQKPLSKKACHTSF